VAQGKKVLEERAEERYQGEQAEYEVKKKEREEKLAKTSANRAGLSQNHRKRTGDKDQYNFTDPDSRIMEEQHQSRVDQHYNVQVAWIRTACLVIARRSPTIPMTSKKRSRRAGHLA